MTLSYQSILCKLPFPVRDLSRGGNGPIRDLMPYDGAAGADPETLYLCPLEDALRAEAGGRSLFFLCPAPEGWDGAAPESPHRIAVAAECVPMRTVATAAFSTFHRLWRWLDDLQQSILGHEGVQGLIDRSEEVLDATVLILDNAHRLLAWSRGRPPRESDPVHRYLVQTGHHSGETVERLESTSRPKLPEDGEDDVVVSNDRSFSDSVTLRRLFRYNGRVHFGALLLCGYAPYSAGLADLFRCFCKSVEFYAETGYPYDRIHTAFDALLRALLREGAETSGKERVSLCAARSEVPMTGLFDLYRLEMRENAAQSTIHVLLNLSDALPSARLTAQRGSIIILNLHSPEEDPEERFEKDRARITALAGDSVAAVGVSNLFQELHDLRRAFVQAGAALEVVREYSITDGARAVMLRFEDCYIGHMILSTLRDDAWLYENCAAHELVLRIREYDRANGTDYAHILLVFLLNERRPTETGLALGLHRNTVIYHVGRMTELFGLELRDPLTRVKLMLSLNRSATEESTATRLRQKP